jgi:hypothetical protein
MFILPYLMYGVLALEKEGGRNMSPEQKRDSF